MTVGRRDFLKAGATVAVVAAIPRPLLVRFGRTPEPVPPVADPRIKALALRAVEAARSAGASYADVRLTHTWERRFSAHSPVPLKDEETLEIGVRALVNGYWGFAASALWSNDESARLGREAVARAKVNAMGKAREVDLGTIPVVHDQHWATPIEEDPFTVPFAEILDLLGAWVRYASIPLPSSLSEKGSASPNATCGFWRQAKAFASSEGSYFTETLNRTTGDFTVDYKLEEGNRHHLARIPTPLAARGWEYLRDLPYRELVPPLYDEIAEVLALPFKPVEVGRYDVVFDAASVASLVDQTIGKATELDRALGYEANAGGTSYLDDPLQMLGSYEMGAPLLTVTGNRSAPGGIASTRWDDEAVMPDEFTIVKDGVLSDYQTTRESAAWLAPWYQRQGMDVHSHGCANAPTAFDPPLPSPPNLALRPGAEAGGFDELIARVEKGFAMTLTALEMDFQQINGLGFPNELAGGLCYEIRDGKKVALVEHVGFLFRSPELWKGLTALGGPESSEDFPISRTKGEPEQTMLATVSAVPAAFKEVTIIDPTRKA